MREHAPDRGAHEVRRTAAQAGVQLLAEQRVADDGAPDGREADQHGVADEQRDRRAGCR